MNNLLNPLFLLESKPLKRLLKANPDLASDVLNRKTVLFPNDWVANEWAAERLHAINAGHHASKDASDRDNWIRLGKRWKNSANESSDSLNGVNSYTLNIDKKINDNATNGEFSLRNRLERAKKIRRENRKFKRSKAHKDFVRHANQVIRFGKYWD